MQSAKSALTPLPIHLRLSQRDCPTSGSEGEDMKSVPYAPAVGSLMYTLVATRPDISHAVGVISRFMHNPGRSHWNAVKHVFRYLAGTKDHDILFGLNSTSGVVGYTDSDFSGLGHHNASKHFEVRYHFVRDCVISEKIGLEKISTIDNVEDGMTKCLSADRFRSLRQ